MLLLYKVSLGFLCEGAQCRAPQSVRRNHGETYPAFPLKRAPKARFWASAPCRGRLTWLVRYRVYCGSYSSARGHMASSVTVDELVQELDKLQVNQVALKYAIDHDKAIVIHPKRDLMDEEEEEVKEKPVPKYVVSGGLTGFGVANDLMFIDFSPPEEAPEEFRAMPYNAKKITTLKSGVSGTFGKVSPGGDILIEYLKQLEEQQAMVKEMIANQRLLLKSGKLSDAGSNPGKLKSATGKMGSGALRSFLESQRQIISN